MAVFQRNQINIKDIGRTVTVPNTPTAKLMYYIDCVCVVLDLTNNSEMQRYRNYANHYSMTRQDKLVIVQLCRLFDPKILNNKVFFNNENMPGSTNNFFEIGVATTQVAAVENFVIGGVRVRATKIMFYKLTWMYSYYYSPLNELIEELRKPQFVFRPANNKAQACIIS